MKLRPFFLYFGGKNRIAKHYPKPKHEIIIEPFAGAAGYSCLYHDRQIILNDLDSNIYSVWSYLINASEKDLLSLPDLKAGETLNDFKTLSEAEKIFIGFWLAMGRPTPTMKPSSWILSGLRPNSHWGKPVREMLAAQLKYIRHWKIHKGDYRDLPNVKATWFIDPPYYNAGSGYRFSNIDYPMLADYCKNRNGQVIVCENAGAFWLAFKFLHVSKGTEGKHRSGKSIEVFWTHENIEENN